jgi:hypothetical protein
MLCTFQSVFNVTLVAVLDSLLTYHATLQVIFDDTPHVQHMLLEREKYLAGLDAFLAKHELLLK